MSDLGWSVGAGSYPLARPRRRRRWRRIVAGASALPRGRVLAGAILMLALVLGGVAWRERRVDPHVRFAEGLAVLREGRFAAAEAALSAALPVEPARAEVALARIAIERGDGAAAQIALQRATAAGMPAARLHQLRAAAQLLDDDTDGARREAGAAPAAYRGFADRTVARALAQDGRVDEAMAMLAATVARRPRDAGGWIDLGTVRLAAGDVAGAAEAAVRSLALDGGSPAALALEGRVVRLRYGPVAAVDWFAAALARDPAFVPALVEQAATLADIGRARDALAAARAALALRPDLPQPFYVMAVLAARADRPALARRLLQRIDAEAMPGAMLLDGWLAQREGHGDLAIAAWQRLAGLQPRNMVVRRLLAAALLRTGDAQGALDMAGPITARGDADSYSLEIAARAARALGRADLAAPLHDRAIGDRRGPSGALAEGGDVAALSAQAAESGGPDAQVALLRGMLARGGGTEAIARAQALVRAAPRVAAPRLVLGDTLMLSGRGGEAAASYAAAANLVFDEPTALRLIDALARTGARRPAATVLATYLAQNPQSLAARRLAGHWQAVAGEPAAHDTVRGLVMATGGGEAAVLADLALAAAEGGRLDAAVRLARAAYRLAPMRLDVVGSYAAVLAKVGDADGAGQLRAKAQALARAG